MQKKRDRHVELFLHKPSNEILLFPYVCYMTGVSATFGDAVELEDKVSPAVLGRRLVRLLRACRKADIEALKARRMAQLRSYRSSGEILKDDNRLGPTWTRLLRRFPALQKGPATFLRQFSACQIIERDGWQHRKVVLVVPSEYRNCTVDGESTRVSITATPSQMGARILEFLGF
jgi:hypothetical protein